MEVAQLFSNVNYPRSIVTNSLYALADLWEVWSKHYEGELEKSDFKVRTQSTIPEVTCKALRRLANYFGRGKKVKKKLTTSDRLTYHLLKAIKGSAYAAHIRDDLPSDDELEGEEEGKMDDGA